MAHGGRMAHGGYLVLRLFQGLVVLPISLSLLQTRELMPKQEISTIMYIP